jgi:hypothetical protein
MKVITDAQRTEVLVFLKARGLTFQPLLDEMTDHICSEAEEMMRDGVTFEHAFQEITSGLPQNHFCTSVLIRRDGRTADCNRFQAASPAWRF